MKTAIIGVGNMGSTYARMIMNKEIEGLELAAITRVKGIYREMLLGAIEAGLPVFESADLLLEAVEKGELKLDAVIVATPHYAHEKITVRALRAGLHVLCDKPSGVYSRQARLMNEASAESGKVYGMIFHQRTFPIYRKIHELVHSKTYGELKRVNWIVTNWYRPNLYYSSSPWRATWKQDGGGVLLNQCPHNLDLLQWICGMPVKVQGFCKEGHFHDIEVEDDATAYFEWENGASGVFITSTGEAPGVNRLEISLDEAMIICENGELRIGEITQELGMKEAEYRRTSTDLFRKIGGTWKSITPPSQEHPYQDVLQAFADETAGKGTCIAPGTDGWKSLMMINAIYLSSWENRMITIPKPGTEEELEFESRFEEWLKKKGE